jgi:ribosome biogenesis GTPase / thiamine phosphate phosphatase
MNTFIARIKRSGKRNFDCIFHDEKQNIPAKISHLESFQAVAYAKILKEQHLVVGDLVKVAFDESNEEFNIVELLTRDNEIFRLIVRENRKKVIGSNVDLICIITSFEKPKYKRGLIDRYLIRAEQWGIPAVVVFNKADKIDDIDKLKFDLEFEIDRLKNFKIQSFEYCSVDQNYQKRFMENSKDEFKSFIKNKTIIFVGQSGVGKSKMISDLSGEQINLKSSKLGKIGKGKHTTTWSELIKLDDFTIIDSPGIRSFSLSDIYSRDIQSLFPDLIDYFNTCKFHDCQHIDNSEGCSFKSLSEDSRDDLLVLSRLESFLKFRDEISKLADWQRDKEL